MASFKYILFYWSDNKIMTNTLLCRIAYIKTCRGLWTKITLAAELLLSSIGIKNYSFKDSPPFYYDLLNISLLMLLNANTFG